MRYDIIAPLAAEVADLSTTAASVFTFTVSGAGYLMCDQIMGRLEEAIAAGGFTTSAGVVTVTIGGVTVATFSTGATTGGNTVAAGAIGKAYLFTGHATNAPGGQAPFTANQVILVACTAGVGGTVTGTMRVTLPIEIDRG